MAVVVATVRCSGRIRPGQLANRRAEKETKTNIQYTKNQVLKKNKENSKQSIKRSVTMAERASAVKVFVKRIFSDEKFMIS